MNRRTNLDAFKLLAVPKPSPYLRHAPTSGSPAKDGADDAESNDLHDNAKSIDGKVGNASAVTNNEDVETSDKRETPFDIASVVMGAAKTYVGNKIPYVFLGGRAEIAGLESKPRNLMSWMVTKTGKSPASCHICPQRAAAGACSRCMASFEKMRIVGGPLNNVTAKYGRRKLTTAPALHHKCVCCLHAFQTTGEAHG